MWLIQREPERAGHLMVLQTCLPLQEGLEGPPDCYPVGNRLLGQHSQFSLASQKFQGSGAAWLLRNTSKKKAMISALDSFFLIPGEEGLSHLTFFLSNTVTAPHSHLFLFKCLLANSPQLGSHSASEPSHVARSSQSKDERNIQATPTERAYQLITCLRLEVFRSKTRNLKL